jgi:U3 small nucleolar RNA-associated protein 10
MSNLAAQLAQHASLNSALLVDRSRRKPTSSYLFTDKEADQHDLESIYSLAVNAFIQLSSLSPSLCLYEDRLFSDQAKVTDRTLLSTEANHELDEAIGKFLALLGPHLMEAPAGRVVEWLVRRFRFVDRFIS